MGKYVYLGEMSPMLEGRVRKSLNKMFRWSIGIYSLRERIEMMEDAEKRITNNMFKWNRRLSNGMDQRQQDAYNARLERGRTYEVVYNGGYSIEVPKIVYDCLLMPIKEGSL